MKRHFLFITVAATILASCSSNTPATNADAGVDGGGGTNYPYPIQDVEVEWFPCSFIYGESDGLAECSSTPMPLDWDDPEGPTIEIYAKRRLSSERTSEGQMWFLHGGPGASGVEGLPGLMEQIQEQYPELDVYTIDHRGVGDSQQLECPYEDSQNYDVQDCIDHLDGEVGEDLQHYSTTASAVDLAAYIHSVSRPGEKVLIWGGSYGTYIGHRYLQIFPDQSDGAVLEGLAPPVSTFIRSPEGFDTAGKDLFSACTQDAYCSSKWGQDPLPQVKNIINSIYYQGHCSEAQDAQYYVPYAAVRLLYYHPYHNVVPALLYRLGRCENQDVQAIWSVIQMLFGQDSTYQDLGDGYSSMLYKNVVYSEMWEHPDFPDADSMYSYWNQLEAEAVFWTGSTDYMLEEKSVWPVYKDDWDDGWADTDTPMLMLQGELDPATHYQWALPMGEHFNGPGQNLVLFPTAAHNVSRGTPVSTDPDETHCGRQMMIDFLKDPTSTPDTSCIADVLPNNFEGDAELSELVFGQPHLWDNAENYAETPPPGRMAAWLETLEQIRRGY